MNERALWNVVRGFELYSGALFNPMDMSFTKGAVSSGRNHIWVQHLEQFRAAYLQSVSVKHRKTMEACQVKNESTACPDPLLLLRPSDQR